MACGACSGRKNGSATQEVEVTFRDGRVQRFADLPSARRAITLSGGGGTWRMVAKSTT